MWTTSSSTDNDQGSSSTIIGKVSLWPRQILQHQQQARIDNISENTNANDYYYYLQDCCLDDGSPASCTAAATATATATATTTATPCSCPTTLPLWVRIARWMIRIVLKPYAPLIYMGFALLVGLLLGILIGRYWDDAKRKLHTWGQWGMLKMYYCYYYCSVGYYSGSWWRPHDGKEQDRQHDINNHSGEQKKDERVVPNLDHHHSGTAKKITCYGKEYTTTTTPTAPSLPSNSNSSSSSTSLQDKEERARQQLQSSQDSQRQCTFPLSQIPQHIAVIMDGNRRYGVDKYNSATQGHWDGCQVLCEFAKWCCAEQISILTVYAFSTENWNRSPEEIESLMTLFATYCEELRVQALQKNIRLCVLSTETDRIPPHVMEGLQRMEQETQHCHGGLTMNICLSYGSRGEIVNACRSIAQDVMDGHYDASQIQEHHVESKLLTCRRRRPPPPDSNSNSKESISTSIRTSSHNEFQHSCHNPDIVIRTSGEYRLSNFLLWQLAYSEMFFLSKPWPELQKQDLLQVLETYAQGRSRRFGK